MVRGSASESRSIAAASGRRAQVHAAWDTVGEVTASGSMTKGIRPAPEAEEDAPGAPCQETPSQMVVRAMVSVASPFLKKWGRAGALTLGLGATGAAATLVSSSQDDPACDPATLQYILHMATRGEELAKVLDAEGRTDHAKAIRLMTDVNELPNDLQICALLSKQGNTTGTTP